MFDAIASVVSGYPALYSSISKLEQRSQLLNMWGRIDTLSMTIDEYKEQQRQRREQEKQRLISKRGERMNDRMTRRREQIIKRNWFFVWRVAFWL